jgi:hypothetical protein
MEDPLLLRWPDSPTGTPSPAHSHSSTFSLGSYNVELLRLILAFNGFTLSTGPSATLFWGTSRECDALPAPPPHRYLNHFPKSNETLCNKGELASLLQNHPRFREFPRFFPLTFTLLKERERLFERMKANPLSLYIAKPPCGSCGNGIRLVQYADFDSIPRGYVVSEYISTPLCLNGFKFDLRIYVLVTSFAPLRAFLYRNGLARFATQTYSNQTTDVFSHLTNATLNKKGRHWSKEFKWTLNDLLGELRVRYGKTQEEIMNQIIRVVSLTLALVQPAMASFSSAHCFELFGFDLLFDRDFTLWLLEINSFPSMGFRSEIDWAVKAPLIAQALSIVGIQANRDPSQRDMVAVENLQNTRSGNGFICLFPSEASKPFARFCVMPRRPSFCGVASLDTILGALHPAQASWLLLRYLSVLEQQMRLGVLGRKARDRVHHFLAAQGFNSARLTTNLRVILHNFIMRETGQIVQSNVDTSFFAKLPESVELGEIVAQCSHFSIPHTMFLFE